MKNHYYQLYGLIIRTKQEIKHLIPTKTRETVDVTVHFQEYLTDKEYSFQKEATEIYASYGLAQNDIPYLTVWKQYESEEQFLVIRYTDGEVNAFFISDKKGDNVKVYYHPNILISNIITYFLGPVIGCILRLKNKVCLHASVVNIKNKAVAFIGEKTAGKSTLIATFAALGYPILSDDIAVLIQKGGQYFVHLGYPRLRLWKNTIEHLPNVEVENLESVLSPIEKYYMPLSLEKRPSYNFQNKPLPLDKVFYLQPRNENNILSINDCKPLEGFLKLKQNIYAEYMLEADLKTKEFEILGRLANDNRVKFLDRPDDLSVLEKICQMITAYG